MLCSSALEQGASLPHSLVLVLQQPHTAAGAGRQQWSAQRKKAYPTAVHVMQNEGDGNAAALWQRFLLDADVS
jgi:hypothetical protein